MKRRVAVSEIKTLLCHARGNHLYPTTQHKLPALTENPPSLLEAFRNLLVLSNSNVDALITFCQNIF